MPISEVEPIVAPLRWQYDKSARLGVPAHVTLLYPFSLLHVAEGKLEDLAELFRSIPAFTFSYVEVRCIPRTAYLYPDQPERFTIIIHKLETWSGCRLYCGAFPDVIPHLTVADEVDTQTLHLVQTSISSQLPVKCVAQEVRLLCSDDAGLWSVRKCFRLGVSDREPKNLDFNSSEVVS
jgi:hypothetical protein